MAYKIEIKHKRQFKLWKNICLKTGDIEFKIKYKNIFYIFV